MFDRLIVRACVLSVAAALTLTAAGCSGKRQVTNPENRLWFCQSDESGNGWDCVQDDNLAQSPVVTRWPPELTNPEPDEEAAEEAAGVASVAEATAPAPGAAAASGDIADLSVDPREEMKRMQVAEHAADEAPPKPPSGTGPAPPPIPEPQAPLNAETEEAISEGENADVPEYVRLAYVPTNPTPILELPGDYYAVQVFAMSTREQIEQFVTQNNLRGMSAARVERDGKLYYVLVLGVYTTYERAAAAVTHLPAPLADADPWIRPMSSLQDAIKSADALAGEAPY